MSLIGGTSFFLRLLGYAPLIQPAMLTATNATVTVMSAAVSNTSFDLFVFIFLSPFLNCYCIFYGSIILNED